MPTRRKAIFYTACFIFSAFGSIVFSQQITVRVPVGNIYAPFFVQDETGNWSGLSIELAEALLAEAELTPVYVPLPFPRALAYIREGQLDMMLNLTITEDRKEFTSFIGPQLDEIVVIVVKKDSDFHINSLDDLKALSKNIGIERGKIYGTNFEEKRKLDKSFSNRLDEVTEINLNEIKLEKDRLSAFLGFGYNTFYRIKTDPLYKNFKVHPFVVNTDWVYFGFSKKSVNKETLSRLVSAYEQAARKGVFDKIRQQYIIQ